MDLLILEGKVDGKWVSLGRFRTRKEAFEAYEREQLKNICVAVYEIVAVFDCEPYKEASLFQASSEGLVHQS